MNCVDKEQQPVKQDRPRSTEDFKRQAKRENYRDIQTVMYTVMGRWRRIENQRVRWGRRQYTQSAITHIRGGSLFFPPTRLSVCEPTALNEADPCSSVEPHLLRPSGKRQRTNTHLYLNHSAGNGWIMYDLLCLALPFIVASHSCFCIYVIPKLIRLLSLSSVHPGVLIYLFSSHIIIIITPPRT